MTNRDIAQELSEDLEHLRNRELKLRETRVEVSVAVPEEVEQYAGTDQEAYDRMGEEDEDDDEQEEDTAEIEDEIEDEDDNQESPFGVWSKDTVGIKRLKVLLYGVSGTGKTTMAATFPKPLFLDLENGLRSTLRVGSVLRYPADPDKSVKKYEQVVDFFNKVATVKNPQFETIVIDSLNELQKLLADYLVAKHTKVKRQYGDQLTLADYGKTNRDFSKVVRSFLNLPYHIVFTAASTSRSPGDDEVQLMPKFVGAQVGPDIQRMMDMIGYCHAKNINGVSQHYVSFHITPQYIAKDRMGIVSRDIPNHFDSLVGSVKDQPVFDQLTKGAK
jgi:hypothetical protein